MSSKKGHTSGRPDPDLLLKRVQEEEGKKAGPVRGKLKVFLGYCAGVGKTFRMLQQARQLKAKGTDVVIGLVETHGRSETKDLLEGMETIPLRASDHSGLLVNEMDLDALLRRKPQLAIVDELAHSNIAMRHAKRYQDVEELLSAGIDVYSTLNIQHVDSLNDVIQQITGIKVAELVPDHVLASANEIEIVDLPADELLVRLKEGKVYVAGMAALAINNFFKKVNLLALRELTLNYAARNVDNSVLSYMETHSIQGPWPIGARLMASFSSSPTSEHVLRYAHRLAKSFGSDWYAFNVDSLKYAGRSSEQLDKNIRIAEELGASVVSVGSEDITGEILDFAGRNNITLIVIGVSRRSRLEELFKGSIINELMKRSGRINVLAVGNKELTSPPLLPRLRGKGPKLYHYLFSLAGLMGMIALGWFLKQWLEPVNIAMLLLLPTFISGILWGNRVGLFAAVSAVLTFDFFFIPPLLTFRISDLRYLPVFIIFIIVSFMLSFLTRMVRSQSESMRNREHFVSMLYSFSRDVLGFSSIDDVLSRASRYISMAFQTKTAFFLPDKNGNLLISTPVEDISENEPAVASWVFKNGSPAGRGTDTLSSSKWYFVPLEIQENILGVIGIRPLDSDRAFNPEQKRLFGSFANIVALALSGTCSPGRLER